MPEAIDNNGRIIARESTLARAVLYAYADLQRTIDIMIGENEAAATDDAADDVMLQKIRARLQAALAGNIKAEKKEKTKLEKLIASVSSGSQKNLLRLRYIELLDLGECSAIIYGSRSDFEENREIYLKRTEGIHRRALNSVERILTKRKESERC